MQFDLAALLTLQIAGLGISVAEAIAFVTGVICVWLAATRNVLTFPAGIVSSAMMLVLFWNTGLYGDSALQILFVALGVQGWWAWLQGRVNEELIVLRADTTDWWLVVAIMGPGAVALWFGLQALGGSAPLLDAAITSGSIAAQILLNRRRVENWLIWIAVDVVSIPLYASRDLWLIAGLYAIFLGLATGGWITWRRTLARQPAAPAAA